MRNFSYRRFLGIAMPRIRECLQYAQDRYLTPLGLTAGYDDAFPWTSISGMDDAVGRCHYAFSDDDTFVISVHQRVIYHLVREELEEYDFLSPRDYAQRFEDETLTVIRETVLHEVAHGIYRYFADMYRNCDEVAELFERKKLDAIFDDDEEELCEEFAEREKFSKLGETLKKFTNHVKKNTLP